MKNILSILGFSLLLSGSPASLEEFKLTASDGEPGHLYGFAVSVDGARAVVGAFGNDENGAYSGAAYVYDWDGTAWNETKLTPSDAAAGDQFGRSVAVSGDRVVVGANNDEVDGQFSGSAYVYDWDGSAWTETKLVPSDGESGDFFGRSIAVDGNRVLVGASGDDDYGSRSGAAYLFEWDGAAWQETKLTPSDGGYSESFGFAVSVDGASIAVGANGGGTDGRRSGSAYLFEWDGYTWNEQIFEPGDGGNNDSYGNSVSLDGNRLLVGSPYHASDGAAYLYKRDGIAWGLTKLTASDPQPWRSYGLSSSIQENRIVIGRHDDDDNGSFAGAAYIYDWDGSAWNETKTLASDGEANSGLGLSVFTDGTVVVAGAPYAFANGNPYSGSAYIFGRPRSIGSMFAALVDDVSSLSLSQGIQNSLLSKLASAEKSYLSGQLKAAVNKLSAFISEVTAKREKQIPAEDADNLLALARELLEAIGGEAVGKGESFAAGPGPTQPTLDGNFPNPFNPRTTINFTLSEVGSTRLEVFDMLGRRVQTLVDKRLDAGGHSIPFDAGALPTGTYIYQLSTPNGRFSKTMQLLK